MSKAFSFCIVALLVFSLCVATTNANQIDNGVMRRDQPVRCSGSRCMPPPSNSYGRGCEKEAKCRDGHRRLK
ncbi:hypothetical protein CerSpe_271560 [Prunus speciosa]